MDPNLGNPYQPPMAEVEGPGRDGMGGPIKVYSPNQVKSGAFFGGPLAAVYLLKSNFDALKKPKGAMLTLSLGLTLTFLLIALTAIVPPTFPKYIVPVASTIAAGQTAQSLQLKKQVIQDSKEYTFQSNWRVFVVSILGIVLYLALAIPIVLGLGAAGIGG